EPRAHRLLGGPGRRGGGLRLDRLRQREPGAADDPPLHPHRPRRRARPLARVRGVGALADGARGPRRWRQGARSDRARPARGTGEAQRSPGRVCRRTPPMRRLLALMLGLLLAGAPASAWAATARAELKDAQGKVVGRATLSDASGLALVIHADPDDEMTDPAGNSGARVACGVITK